MRSGSRTTLTTMLVAFSANAVPESPADEPAFKAVADGHRHVGEDVRREVRDRVRVGLSVRAEQVDDRRRSEDRRARNHECDQWAEERRLDGDAGGAPAFVRADALRGQYLATLVDEQYGQDEEAGHRDDQADRGDGRLVQSAEPEDVHDRTGATTTCWATRERRGWRAPATATPR